MNNSERILLINDSTNWYHFGCTATSFALQHELRKLSSKLTIIPISETYKITGAPEHARFFSDLGYYKIFEYQNKNLINIIRKNDVIVVNGEGTLHGLRQAPLNLLYLIFISKYFLNKKVEIINHSVYPQDDLQLSITQNIEIYKLVYNIIDYAAIREPLSFKLMQTLNVAVSESFDCLPLYINNFYKRHYRKDKKTLILSGSAAWLNLNILSRQGGNIKQYNGALNSIINYLVYMHHNGYDIKFLYSDIAYPAKDDLELIDFLKQNLQIPWNIIAAKNANEWLSHIEEATILISGRFHHTIAAACLNTNFIILSSNTPKVLSLATILDVDVIDINQDDIENKLKQKTTQYNIPKHDPLLLNNLCKMALNNFRNLKL